MGRSDDLAVGAIEGPAPPVDDGGFVALQHRCVRCGVVREVLIPSIDGIDVRELRGRCAQCERTAEAPDGPVLGPVERGAVLRAPVEQAERPPYVVGPLDPRPQRADVMRAMLAGSPVLLADQFGEMRPAAEVVAGDETLAAHLAPRSRTIGTRTLGTTHTIPGACRPALTASRGLSLSIMPATSRAGRGDS